MVLLSSAPQQRLIRRLPDEGVLEGYGAAGHPRRLVEQLRGLEVGQTSLERRRGQPRDGLEQGDGNVLANDRRHL
jgi:hypothetical protein